VGRRIHVQGDFLVSIVEPEPGSADHQVTRTIAPPTSISAAAAEQLATMMALGITDADPPTDVAGWEAMIDFANEMLAAMVPSPSEGTTVELVQVGGVPAYDVTPHTRSTERVCLFLHGGALIMGAGAVCAGMTTSFAEGAEMQTVGVDYRMPPHHPYPTPLDDCFAAYQELLVGHDPADIVVAGVSAGGNLGPALVLRARDEGLPLPAAVVLLSPEVDLTESGDSFETVVGIDPVLTARLAPSIKLYASDHDLTDPYLSPLFGDFAPGFPATFLQCGTRDLFLSNTVRFHRALRAHDIPAELHVFEAMPHGGFGSVLQGGLGDAPEDREVYTELRRFLASL
jgi:epsilon-lactone hydrolase